jgi:hypothetical protein
MAINPLSSSIASSASLLPISTPAPAPAPAPTSPPSLQELQALEGAALDPLLVDPAAASTVASGQDPLLQSFNSMSGGDPLLDELNALDSGVAPGSADPAATEDAALNQSLTSFLIQQASSSYTASQLLGSSSGTTGALGNASA